MQDKTAKIELDVSKSIRKFKKKINVTIATVRIEAFREEVATKELKKVSKRLNLKFKEKIDPSKK